MSTFEVTYCLIIPAFNECDSLPSIITQCKEILNYRTNMEIIILDNGSVDNTKQILRAGLSTFENERIRYIIKEINSGYGAGIKFAIENSNAPVIIWTHADLQCDLWDVLKVIEAFEANGPSNCLVTKGERLNRSFVDRLFSNSFSVLNRFVNKVSLKDINAQPNLIPRDFLKNLDRFPDDSTFELSVLTQALRQKCLIGRVAVQFPRRKFGVGANQGLTRKIRYSLRCVRVIFEIRRKYACN